VHAAAKILAKPMTLTARHYNTTSLPVIYEKDTHCNTDFLVQIYSDTDRS